MELHGENMSKMIKITNRCHEIEGRTYQKKIRVRGLIILIGAMKLHEENNKI